MNYYLYECKPVHGRPSSGIVPAKSKKQATELVRARRNNATFSWIKVTKLDEMETWYYLKMKELKRREPAARLPSPAKDTKNLMKVLRS